MTTLEDTTLSHEEESILKVLAELKGAITETVSRRGARTFDLNVAGTEEIWINGQIIKIRFSGWLPLMAIRDLLSVQDLAKAFAMSDIPEMAGDWSAIRDSEEETIWRIFNTLVLRREESR